MIYRNFILLALFAFLLGCSEDLQKDPVLPTDDISLTEKLFAPFASPQALVPFSVPQQQPHLNGKAVERELKMKSSGTLTYLPNSADCGGNYQVVVEGEGNASHLGKFSIRLTYCHDGVNALTPPVGTQVAANGDTLFMVLVYHDVDPDLGYYQDYIYYGGTGRFTGASGEIRLYANIDYQNLVWTNYGIGTLTY